MYLVMHNYIFFFFIESNQPSKLLGADSEFLHALFKKPPATTNKANMSQTRSPSPHREVSRRQIRNCLVVNDSSMT